MPTNNTKHTMLKLAKQIANKEYKDKVEVIRGLDFSITGHAIIPASLVKEKEIDEILKNHPEFDSTEFRRMIKKFMQENKGKEEDFLL